MGSMVYHDPAEQSWVQEPGFGLPFEDSLHLLFLRSDCCVVQRHSLTLDLGPRVPS